ncbi:hypothetical protein [Devosia sp.]|uniref:hypothetical protein n=1 Tax=Devosia sp. TaxID=1871048 RepID=UPI003A949916
MTSADAPYIRFQKFVGDNFLASAGFVLDDVTAAFLGIEIKQFAKLELSSRFPTSTHVAHSTSGRSIEEVLSWAITHLDHCDCEYEEVLQLMLPYGYVRSDQLSEVSRGLSSTEIALAVKHLGFPGAHCVDGLAVWLKAELDCWFASWEAGVAEVREALKWFA